MDHKKLGGLYRVIAYLSLKPAPVFEFTERTASSKLHDEAAWTTPAPTSSREENKELESRMFKFGRANRKFVELDGTELISVYYVASSRARDRGLN